MKIIYALLIPIVLCSCNTSSKNEVKNNKPIENNQSKTAETKTDYTIAVNFMNNYVDYISDTIGKISDDEFIKKNKFVTQQFKDRYKTIIDSANKAEPEVGLDFDPIIDGQDYPDKGFKIKSIDEKNGFVTLSGIDWTDFEVAVKVVNENNKTFVDGSGIINIPTNKQAKR